MGSLGNQNPWQTYDTYKDCSQGICSIYCPQWCYILFPPPPPFSLSDDGDGGADFSPLIIAVIGILASAFILVTYYTIISKYCRRRSSNSGDGENGLEWTNESWQGGPAAAATPRGGGLDESVIKSITVWKYRKSENSADSADCSVCLTEFQENESVRLLPKCNHAFHLPCIDTWLKSSASCPLCRTNIASPELTPPENQETPAPANTRTVSMSVSAQEYQYYRSNDSILVVQDLEVPTGRNQTICDNSNEDRDRDGDGDGIRPIRRSASLNNSSSSSSSLCQNGNIMSIADILLINDEDDQIREIMEIKKNEIMKLIRSPVALKRSISTGRFMFMSRSYENHRNSLIPN